MNTDYKQDKIHGLDYTGETFAVASGDLRLTREYPQRLVTADDEVH